MKKFFLFIVFASLFLLTACGQGDILDVSLKSVTFSVDNMAEGGLHSLSELELVPDYELRTLQVNYDLTFPERTEETLESDFEAEGIIGGDYFERFENILIYFEDEEFMTSYSERTEGEFLVLLSWEDETSAELRFSLADSTEVSHSFVLFFDDVTALFEEEVY